jgi:hypothetical protein
LIWKSIIVLASKLNAQIILITMTRDAIYAFKRTWDMGRFPPVFGLTLPTFQALQNTALIILSNII